MCILEKTRLVHKEKLDAMPYFCRSLATKVNDTLAIYDDGKVEVPLIMTLKKNPVPFLPDIYYVCQHLGLNFPVETLYKMSCLFLNQSTACPKAIESMGTTRKKYFCATYVISRKLVTVNNYLAETAFRTRLPEWIKRNRSVVTRLLEDFNPGNDYIAESYLNEVNMVIRAKSENRNKKRLNKCTINVLAEQKTYISKYLITYLGAVRWFRWTPQGALRRRLLTELSLRVERNMTTDEMFMDSEMVAPELSDYVHRNSIAEAIKSQKEERKRFILRQASDKAYRKSRTNYWNALEYERYLKDRKSDKDNLDKEALSIYNKFVRYTSSGSSFEDDEDAYILAELQSSPSGDKHFLLGFIWEELYGRLGELQRSVSMDMRRQRLLLANKQQIYVYRAQIPMVRLDMHMHAFRKDHTPDALPDWLDAKKYMRFNNIYYPEKSLYMADRALQEIKDGNYVDVVQMYKNNAISTKMYITASLLQKTLRKLAKKENIVVFDKHQFTHNILNNCKQQFKDLMAYSHNARRFQTFATKYVHDYIWERKYIENAQIRDEGVKINQALRESRVKILEVTRAVGMPIVRTFASNIDRFAEGIGRAVEALNDLERFRMPVEDFGMRSSVIREYLDSCSSISTTNLEVAVKQGVNPTVKYLLLDDPVFTIFINRLINYLIRFKKYLKWTNSYYNLTRRINSKPLRQVEEILMLRFRRLWDLRETGRVFVKDDTEWGLKEITLTKEMMKDYRRFTNEDYIKSLRAMRERRDDYKGELELKDSFKFKKSFSQGYRISVATALGRKFFASNDFLNIRRISSFIMSNQEMFTLHPKPIDPAQITLIQHRTRGLIPSDDAAPQIMSAERFEAFEQAMAANPGKGKKKRSKKKREKDKSFETAISALKED